MAHSIDGFTAEFTHRGSWKAHLYDGEQLVATVPVTWTKGTWRDESTKQLYQRVWLQRADELESLRLSREPFLVVVAHARNYDEFPHAVKHMNAVFRVVPTGESLEEQTIECRVLERVRK